MLALALALVTATHPARAGDKGQARSLFLQGRELMKQGRVDEACPRFAASLAANVSIGAQLNLARCHEQQGKTATAWAEYNEAARLAREANDADREQGARQLATKLEPHLSKLTVTPQVLVTGLTIERNGVPIDEGSYGAPFAVDPGEQVVVASAPGHQRYQTTVTVGTDADEQRVVIPPLERDEGAGGSGGALRIVGAVAAGVGAAAVAVGAIVGATVLADASAAEQDPALCPEKRCSPAGRERIDAAETRATAATVSIVAGGGTTLAGVLLLVLAPAPREGDGVAAHPAAVHLSPLSPTGHPGFSVMGSF